MAGPTFKMADLKRSKESLTAKSAGKISPEPYSYEHRISLDQDALNKLGMDAKDLTAGDHFHVMGHAEVKSISQDDRGAGDKSTRVELQFKRLGLKPKAPSDNGLLDAVNNGVKQAETD